MGFSSPSLGFNEPTLTTVAYVCYLLGFLLYTVHVLTRSGRLVGVSRGRMALAAAGMGSSMGTVDVDMTDEPESRSRPGLSPLLGNLALGLVILAWASLTTGLILR